MQNMKGCLSRKMPHSHKGKRAHGTHQGIFSNAQRKHIIGYEAIAPCWIAKERKWQDKCVCGEGYLTPQTNPSDTCRPNTAKYPLLSIAELEHTSYLCSKENIQKYDKTKVPYHIYGYTPLHYRSAPFKKNGALFL